MNGAPDTDAIARRLGVDRDRLEDFAEALTRPTPEAVLGFADRDDPPVDRETVAVWLRAELERQHARKRKRGLVLMNTAELKTGDVVVDRDAGPEDREAAVVVNTPPVAARDWKLFHGLTVAEYDGNEEYDPNVPVALVVYRAELGEWRPGYNGRSAIPATSLEGAPVEYYTFPAPRLKVVEPTDGNTAAPLHAIANAVRSRRVKILAVDRREAVVKIEKLGVEHTIEADGTVDGTGRTAERLEEIATAALAEGKGVTAE